MSLAQATKERIELESAIRDFVSTRCVCGGTKPKREAFCQKCNRCLPAEMRQAVTNPFSESYAEMYTAAKRLLRCEEMMTLEEYRRTIREKWLPLTGRKKLSTSDYGLIQRWFNDGVPVDLVVQAIETARRQSKTLFALGYIAPHLTRLGREKAKSQVGAARDEEWHAAWSDNLEELAESSNPELAAMYRELRAALPKLSRAEAERRWKEIHG